MNTYEIINLDCRDAMSLIIDPQSVDAIVTDPPYELGFMGKGWDSTGIANDAAMWRAAFDCLKPGGHLLAFSGTRTYHRMVCAIEDAGFEVRDQIGWVYGSGFPKSLDVSKAIDKAAGVERTEVIGTKLGRPGMAKNGSNQSFDSSTNTYGGGGVLASDITAPATDAARQWQGWGTALKPAWEPIVLARKPLIGTVAANMLAHGGTGALNIDGCRVEGAPRTTHAEGNRIGNRDGATSQVWGAEGVTYPGASGRWPANLIHDGSDEVLAAFPWQESGSRAAGVRKGVGYGSNAKGDGGPAIEGSSAARFFYCAKASRSDRGADNTHPTVKPTELMRYLCRLVTPPGGLVLDPFLGSGSTGKAAVLEGFRFVGCELSDEYARIAEARIAAAYASTLKAAA